MNMTVTTNRAGRSRRQPNDRIRYIDNRQHPVEHEHMVHIEIDLHEKDAPAFRSAIEEIRNEVGGRLEGAHRFKKEDALTRAASALGMAFASIAKAIPAGDPDYAK